MEELLYFAKNLLIEEGELELSYRVHANVTKEVAEEISGKAKKLFRSWLRLQDLGGFSRKEFRKDFVFNLLRELKLPHLAQEYAKNSKISYLIFLDRSIDVGIEILPFSSNFLTNQDSIRSILKNILTQLNFLPLSNLINSLRQTHIDMPSLKTDESEWFGFLSFLLKHLERTDILKSLTKRVSRIEPLPTIEAIDFLSNLQSAFPSTQLPKTSEITAYSSPSLPTRKGTVILRRRVTASDLARRGILVEAHYRHNFDGMKELPVFDFDTKLEYSFPLYHRDHAQRKTTQDGKLAKIRNDTYLHKTAAFATRRSLRVEDEIVIQLYKGSYTLYLYRKRFQGPIITIKANHEYLVTFPTPNRGFGQFTLTVKQRLDPSPTPSDTFADEVVKMYLENNGDLELVAKSIESANLNFARYGDTLFEVVFVGGRTLPGTTKSDEGERHTYSVIDCEPKRKAILPHVLYLQKILCGRPCLVKNFENVMRRFLQSLEFFEENERRKLAIFTALTFSEKVCAISPETVVQPLLKDNLVAKGIVLTFITEFCKEYLIDNSVDDLVLLLKRGKMEDNLLVFFPPAKRSLEGFSDHFRKEGLTGLVEYNEEKLFQLKLKELKCVLTTQIAEETDVLYITGTVTESNLPKIEIIGILWDVIMESVTWSGNTEQQNADSARCQVKTWAGLLNTLCNSRESEFELINKVQTWCDEDAKLTALFPVIVSSLYEQKVLRGDTIGYWFNEGTSNSKGRKKFVKALEPFVKSALATRS